MKKAKFLILLSMVFVSGCIGSKRHNPETAYYYLNPHKDLKDLGRVALLELANESAYPKISSDVTDGLYGAIQKRQVYGIMVVRQNDLDGRICSWGKFAQDYTLEQLAAIHKTLKADAVLRGTVTRYEPFPHLILGLRMELTDLTDGQLLWAAEQIWDAADQSTQARIRDYYKTSLLPKADSLEVGLGTRYSPAPLSEF
jgi:hypothetical protein